MYRIITDGSCDMPKKLAEKRNITVVPFYVTKDEKTYLKEGVDITKTEFYQWMVDNPTEFPRSSTPSAQDFLDAFAAACEAGEDVLCICITKKFSSSFDVATAAKLMIADTYPDRRIEVVNSGVNTVLQALFTLEAANMRDKGYSLDECIAGLERIKPSGRIFFTVGSIGYLAHGGRIGKLVGLADSILKIRPIITLKEGEIFPSGISRARNKSLEQVEKLIAKYVSENFKSADEYEIVVGYGHDLAEALEFRRAVEALLLKLGHEKRLECFHIGAVISVHTGPYPLGVGIIRKA